MGVFIFRRDARVYCKGASNAEPKLRTYSDIATMKNWNLPTRVVSARLKINTPILLPSILLL